MLIECESISLSRDVPTLLRLFVSGMVEGIARESLEQDARQPQTRASENYLKRSSKALRALEGAADFVSRSTVVRGSKSAQVLRASLGETRVGTGLWHSNGAPVSKWTH